MIYFIIYLNMKIYKDKQNNIAQSCENLKKTEI